MFSKGRTKTEVHDRLQTRQNNCKRTHSWHRPFRSLKRSRTPDYNVFHSSFIRPHLLPVCLRFLLSGIQSGWLSFDRVDIQIMAEVCCWVSGLISLILLVVTHPLRVD